MQRLACLLIGITAACGGDGTDSGPATLSGTTPQAKSVGARVFSGKDGEGKDVLGWKIEFFEQGPGANCLSTDTKVVARIGIYTNTLDDGKTDQALLSIGDISIVTTSPPTAAGQAVALMSGEGVVITSGIVSITEFHLSDLTHGDRIKGTVTAGGTDGMGNPMPVTGTFDAPYCPE